MRLRNYGTGAATWSNAPRLAAASGSSIRDLSGSRCRRVPGRAPRVFVTVADRNPDAVVEVLGEDGDGGRRGHCVVSGARVIGAEGRLLAAGLRVGQTR